MLREKVGRLNRMTLTVEKMMEARKMGLNLDPDDMLEVFGDIDPTAHAQEAEERWGNTEAYRESHRRTSQYTKDDWKRITSEAEEISARLAAAMDSGAAADSTRAMDAAEEHRRHISRWFYNCTYEIHRGLAEMYTADPRFAANYDTVSPGLSGYVHDAIIANAERNGA
jgi:hypothetical protein